MRTETMTSRERVQAAIRHQPVDRVPIDLGSHMSTGISLFAYHALRKHLGLPTHSIWIPDMVQGLAYVNVDILERFHIDCILLEPPYTQTMEWNPRGFFRFAIPEAAQPRLMEDQSWVVRQGEASMRMPKDGYFFDGHWLSDWGEGSEDERIQLYGREAERIYKETDYAVNFAGYSHGLGFGSFNAGSIDDAVLACEQPDRLHDMRERQLEESIRRMGKVLDAFGPYIQMVSLGDDMGNQNGPMCGPAYVEEFCMPYYKRFCDFVHEHSDIAIFLHCCGSVKPLIPLFIEAGIDIFNPVQISANNMDPEELKAEFGSQICFWGGGCNTQHVLGEATADEVAAHVTQLMSVFKPGGGFVFNQVHNIMGNVPPENIVAMLDTAYAEGFYSTTDE